MNISQSLQIGVVAIAFSLLLSEKIKAQEQLAKTFSQTSDTSFMDIAERFLVLKNIEYFTTQLPNITTEVFLSFCEEEMELEFTPQEKIKFSALLQDYFTKFPLFSLNNQWTLQCYLTPRYMEEMVHSLMPHFIGKLPRYLRLGIAIIGERKAGDKAWEKIIKELRTENLSDAKIMFIKYLGSGFQKLDKAIQKECKILCIPYVPFTIGEYYDIIMFVFHNAVFQDYLNRLNKDLFNQPISNLEYKELP